LADIVTPIKHNPKNDGSPDKTANDSKVSDIKPVLIQYSKDQRNQSPQTNASPSKLQKSVELTDSQEIPSPTDSQ